MLKYFLVRLRVKEQGLAFRDQGVPFPPHHRLETLSDFVLDFSL